MMVLEHSDTRISQPEPADFQEVLATDLVQRYHRALQAAVLSDDDRLIGRALDALGVAYGILNSPDRTLHYCAIAADILQNAGDHTGAAIALHHTRAAARLLRKP